MTLVTCHSCNETFASYKDLAIHILSSKRNGHKKGRVWAAKYLSINGLSPDKRVERKKQNGFVLTEDDKINRESTRRELSGKTEYAETVCPRCDGNGGVYLEVEFLQDPLTWRIGDRLAVLCSGCRR